MDAFSIATADSAPGLVYPVGSVPADAFLGSASAAGGAQNPLLGIYAKFASLSATRKRYFLLSAARDLSPSKRLKECRRFIIPGKTKVLVLRSKEHHKCFYGNLVRCGLLWQCPICSVVISERRRLELMTALQATSYHQLLVTFTLRHRLSDPLKNVLDALLEAHRDFVSGKGWVSLRRRYGFVGSVRGLEVTHGEINGWHPHHHSLMLFEKSLPAKVFQQLERDFKARWLMVLQRQGFDASWKHGLDISSHHQRLAEYVEKFGRDPVVFSDGKGWTVEHELTKSAVKLGRYKGRTPAQLLLDYACGDRQAGALWVEYAKAFRGKHHLQWRHGLRRLLGLGVEKSDDELAVEENDSANKLCELSAEQWHSVLKHDMCGQLLEVGEFGGSSGVEMVLRVLDESPDSLQAVLSGFYRLYGRQYLSALNRDLAPSGQSEAVSS